MLLWTMVAENKPIKASTIILEIKKLMLTQDRLYPTKVNVYANRLAYTYVKWGLQISKEKYVPEWNYTLLQQYA